jgi:DNA repair protein NreA
MISPELCIRCKGKLLCGLKKCPILEKNSMQTKIVSKIKDNEFSGATPPGFFVSWQNYPKVAVAPLSALPEELSPISDSPEQWYGLPQEQIIQFRESLLRSYKSMPVSQASDPNYELQDFQELAMSEKLLDVDVKLNKAPRTETNFDSFSAPMGPSAELNKLSLIENSKIPKKIDYYYSDTDAKSNTALIELFEDGFPVSTLAKVLSSGALGVKKNRKLVPTRWSIVATLNSIGKNLIERVK